MCVECVNCGSSVFKCVSIALSVCRVSQVSSGSGMFRVCQVCVEFVKCVSSVSIVCRVCQVCFECLKCVSSVSSVCPVCVFECQVRVECVKCVSCVVSSVY